jgi:hypothetical protein
LIHQPRVLLLDEPTSGLDPASARHVRDLILGLRSDGRAVLVSTHNLGEAEELSDRIGILKTDLLAFDTLASLRAARAGGRVVIELEDRTRREFAISDVAEIPAIVSRLAGEGARIIRVTPEERSLEDVYLDLVGKSDDPSTWLGGGRRLDSRGIGSPRSQPRTRASCSAIRRHRPGDLMVFASLLPLFLVIFLVPMVMGRTLEQSGEFTKRRPTPSAGFGAGGLSGNALVQTFLFHQFSLFSCSSRSSQRRRWQHTR